MLPRKLYYDILLAGFAFLFIYSSFRMFLPYDIGVHIQIKYFGYFMDAFVFFIILCEALRSGKIIKWVSISLIPFAFIGRMFMILHWPFGLILFMVSTLTIWSLLVISVCRSKTDIALRILILLYPLTRVVFHRIFFYHLQIPWWLIDFSVMGIIAITLAVKRIKSANYGVDSAK
ncbi:MAG: hypothetical protein V4506_08505 [Bacteroidota bacterium]